MAIENNPERWRQLEIHFELNPGWACDHAWDFRMDAMSFPDVVYATEYLSIILSIIKNAGGGIPLMVENNFTVEWQQELNDAAEKLLGAESLAMLATTLKDVPIYLPGDRELVDAPADVEGKMFWTPLSSDQFSPHN